MGQRLVSLITREASYAGKPLLYAGTLLLNYLYPPYCPGCGLPAAAAAGLCRRCRLLLASDPDMRRWSEGSDFSYCAGKFYLSQVIACWDYSPLLGRIIQAIKYSGRPRLGVWMGELAADRLRACLLRERCDLIVPVPLHALRRRERGYNQSRMIARGIASRLTIPVSSSVLKRVRPTVTQTSLSGEERQVNTAGVFQVRNRDAVRGSHVLIIDDVVTTGATMNSAAEALVAAGAGRVSGAALARPVLGLHAFR
ncbi:ComF family protein [bacterium]|nr:ComF family protein [bacterium]